MNLPIIVSLLTTLAFGIFAIVYSRREEAARHEIAERERKQKQRLYEIQILKEIQDRIGYSLDVEKVVDIITGSLKNLFPYSVASSLLLNNNRLVFKSYIEESVSHDFIESIKQTMIEAYKAHSHETLPSRIHESLSGIVLDDTSTAKPVSTLNIPFQVNNKVAGILNISSGKERQYTEDEVAILYQITSQASHALSRLETVLKIENGKLMAMIGSLADGVFMVNNRNEIMVMNNTAKIFLNLSFSEPTFLEVVNALSPYDTFGKNLEQAMHGKTTIPQKEIRVGERVLQVFITPVLSPGKLGISPDDIAEHDTIGVAVLLHDITLEKNLQQMKEDFTNMIVHELRAPLTAVKDATTLLAQDDGKLDQATKSKLMTLVNEQSRRLLSQVSSILDAAKLDSGRFIIHKASGDFKKLVDDVMAVFEPQAQTKRIKLVKNVPDSIPAFSFDSGYMGQVITNLLSNSMKFTPENGTIMLHVGLSDKTLIMTVSDTGAGIPKDKQSSLFSKFVQAPSSMPKDKQQTAHTGTGLGLYIVKGIVEAHNGTIKLESEEGKGASFTVTIPMTTEDAKDEPLTAGVVKQPATPQMEVKPVVN